MLSDALQITMIWFVLAVNGAFTIWLWWQHEDLKIRVQELEREREKPKRDLTAGKDWHLYAPVDDKTPTYAVGGPVSPVDPFRQRRES